MLDHIDQLQLERNLERRNSALHRTLSMLVIATGAIIISSTIENVYGRAVANVVVVLCISYCVFLLYCSASFNKTAKQLKQQAKDNELEFTENMEAFLESVGKRR